VEESNPCAACGDPELLFKGGDVILSAGAPGRTLRLSLSSGQLVSVDSLTGTSPSQIDERIADASAATRQFSRGIGM